MNETELAIFAGAVVMGAAWIGSLWMVAVGLSNGGRNEQP